MASVVPKGVGVEIKWAKMDGRGIRVGVAVAIGRREGVGLKPAVGVSIEDSVSVGTSTVPVSIVAGVAPRDVGVMSGARCAVSDSAIVGIAVGWASVGPGSGVDGTVVVSAAEDVSCSPRVSVAVASWVKV